MPGQLWASSLRKVSLSSDEYLPVERVGRPLADALAAELRVVPGGHFLPLENPAGVLAALAACLNAGVLT